MRKFIIPLAFVLAGCYLNHFPVTPQVAESGTYEMFVNTLLGQAQGTAWAVDKHHLITAGHMCDGMAESSVLTSTISGRSIRAKAIFWEQGSEGRADLCLLETRQELNNPLVIADKMPVVGEKIYFVGWPLGVELKSEGKYLGDLDGPDNHYNDDVFDAPCDHGASGSAMFTSRGVWGVLVRIRTDNDTHDGLLPSDGMREGSEGGVAIPLKELVNFLKEGNVDYTATPESPSVDIPDEV